MEGVKRSELGFQCPLFEGEGNNDFWGEKSIKKEGRIMEATGPPCPVQG